MRMHLKVVAAVAIVFTGCAPRLYVNVLHPAGVNLGPAKTLAVGMVEGSRDAQAAVLNELAAQTAAAGYFNIVTRNDAPAPGEVGLRVSIQDYSATQSVENNRSTWVGQVVIGLGVVTASGHPIAAGLQYKGNLSAKSREEALGVSTRAAVAALLEDVTPSFVQQEIRLDDEDEAQKPIIDIARSGDLGRAIEEERTLMKTTPTASAAFNLGALLDSQGEYKEALALYDEALKRAPKDLYAEARAQCARRLGDSEALAH